MSARRRDDKVKSNSVAQFRVGDWPMHSILAIGRCHVRNMGIVLQPFECSPLVWRVLSIVCERDRCSIGQLADISVIERSNLSRIVDGMQDAGLVTKLNASRDKRETRVTVTAKGRSLFAESLGSVLGYYGRFLSGVSQEERSVFMAVLKRIERNVCGPSAELIDR